MYMHARGQPPCRRLQTCSSSRGLHVVRATQGSFLQQFFPRGRVLRHIGPAGLRTMPISRSQRLQAAMAVYRAIRKQRASAHSRALLQLERSLLSGQQDAIAAVLALMHEQGGARRTIQRAAGKWRGSTLAGYLHLGDDAT